MQFKKKMKMNGVMNRSAVTRHNICKKKGEIIRMTEY